MAITDLSNDPLTLIFSKIPAGYYHTTGLAAENFELPISRVYDYRRKKKLEETLVVASFSPSEWLSLVEKRTGTGSDTVRWFNPFLVDSVFSGKRSMAAYDRKIFMVETEEKDQAKLRVLDLVSKNWSDTGFMTFSRPKDPVLVELNGRIYVFGGTGVDHVLLPEVYNIETNQWSQIPEPNLKQTETVLLIGSRDGETVEIWAASQSGRGVKLSYRPGGSWVSSVTGIGLPPCPCHTAVIGTRVTRVLGNLVVVYDDDTMQWFPMEDSTSSLQSPFHIMDYNGKLLCLSKKKKKKSDWEMLCSVVELDQEEGYNFTCTKVWSNVVQVFNDDNAFLGSTSLLL